MCPDLAPSKYFYFTIALLVHSIVSHLRHSCSGAPLNAFASDPLSVVKTRKVAWAYPPCVWVYAHSTHIPSGMGRQGHLGIKDPRTLYSVGVRCPSGSVLDKEMHARSTGVPGLLAYM